VLERRRAIRDLQIREYEHPFLWWPKFLLMLFVCLYLAARLPCAMAVVAATAMRQRWANVWASKGPASVRQPAQDHLRAHTFKPPFGIVPEEIIGRCGTHHSSVLITNQRYPDLQ
jgi:hypothetical protein